MMLHHSQSRVVNPGHDNQLMAINATERKDQRYIVGMSGLFSVQILVGILLRCSFMILLHTIPPEVHSLHGSLLAIHSFMLHKHSGHLTDSRTTYYGYPQPTVLADYVAGPRFNDWLSTL
jgi:hypothetical protein